MKREFLAELGLDKEVIDKIMAENGKDIQAEKDKTANAEKDLAVLQDTLTEANDTIKAFKDKDLDVEAAVQTAKDWEQKFKDAEKLREAEAKNNALMQEIAKTGTVDADLLKACLNMDEIIVKDGKVIGLDDQITSIKENKPYLFETQKKQTIKGAQIGEPKDSDDGNLVDFSKMTYSEMTEYIKTHPESAALL